METACQSNIEVTQIIVRAILLTMVSAGGILCIYLGWRLYKDSIISKVTGEFSRGDLKLKITSACPGILLAAFGSYLLFTVAQHRFTINTSIPIPRSSSAQWSEHGATSTQNLRSKLNYLLTVADRPPPVCEAPARCIKTDPNVQCFVQYRTTVNVSGNRMPTVDEFSQELGPIKSLIAKLEPKDDADRNTSRRAIRTLDSLSLLFHDSLELERENENK